ncbi:MAG: aldolase/citrate lyase family protein, partial [Pseudomonadota bacterium]
MSENEKPPKLRRTMMLTPGNRPERLAKATQLNIDAAAFDLEDGVGPDQKAEARQLLIDDLACLGLLVRPNTIFEIEGSGVDIQLCCLGETFGSIARCQ